MVRFITKDGKRIPIDDNKPRRSGSGNDKSEGMNIGSGTRVPKDFEEADKETALDFIKRHPDSIADNLSESTDIEDVERIVTQLELEGKIIKHGDEEFPEFRIAEQLKSNITREVGDPSSETRLFDPLVETSPIVDGEKVRSSLLIQVINMLEATGDKRFEDEPYVGELLLVPMNQSLSKEKLKDIAKTAGISTSEVDDADKIGHGASFRIGDELSGVDPIDLVNQLEEDVPRASSNPEEFLDQQVNRIGDTIEDGLRELTE